MALPESSGHSRGSRQGASGAGIVSGLSTGGLWRERGLALAQRAGAGKSYADVAAVEARKHWGGELVRLETAAAGALAGGSYGGGGIGQGNGTARAIK